MTGKHAEMSTSGDLPDSALPDLQRDIRGSPALPDLNDYGWRFQANPVLASSKRVLFKCHAIMIHLETRHPGGAGMTRQFDSWRRSLVI